VTSAAALAGVLSLRPGPTGPNIRSTRQAWVRTLSGGRPAAELPDLLAAVLPLCGDAHRHTARAALQAAAGHEAPEHRPDDDRALQLGTLGEHLRRMWLDWPPALRGRAVEADELAVLRDCPVLRRGAPPAQALADAPAWLESRVLGQPASEWLAAWDDDAAGCLERWCGHADTLPAQLLRGCRDAARALGGVPRPLRVHADAGALATLAAQLRDDPWFALAPQWQGAAFETGPWTRLNDPWPERHDNAWLRLGARLAEAVRLGLPDVDGEGRTGAGWLRRGALALGDGEGMAWCEMARGLLVHRVRLADGPDGPRIAECDVLAPTEWNFQPQGAVAMALRCLAADGDEAKVHLLAAAFDPCVTVQVLRAGQGASEGGGA
jgi:hypothetical protein